MAGTARHLGTSKTNLRYWVGKHEIRDAFPPFRAVWTVEKVRAAVEGATSKREVLRRLGLRDTGSIYGTLARFAETHSIVLPVYDRTATRPLSPRMPVEEIFTTGSSAKRPTLLPHMLDTFGMAYECAECGTGPTWRGEELVLEIDHINGVHSDNRIENLRFLCPNCHSQAETSHRQTTAVSRMPS